MPRHACRVHDMMLELIISKSTEENFITLVNGRQTVWGDSHCFIRRLSIQEIDQELASELAKKDLSHVRSLTVTSSSCIKYLPSLAKFKALRVLDFEGCEGFGCLNEYDMNGMDGLFHLKYLSFRNTSILELHSGIVKLHELETLDLRGTRIWELPARIVELIKLEHLLYQNNGGIWAVKIPTGIEKMNKLREILGLNITISSVDAVEELGNLINLNVLGVLYDPDFMESDNDRRHADALLSSICKLGSYKLQSLCIDTGNMDRFELLDSWSPPSGLQSFEMKPYYRLSELKLTAPALKNLVNLRINLSEVTEEDLLILGELPALLYLDLQSTVQKDRLAVKKGGFTCLKQFALLVYEAVWECLLFEKGAMPDLERLSLTVWVRDLASTTEAYGFYLGIEHLQCLKVVVVDVMVSHLWQGDAISPCSSSLCTAARAAIKKEANLHPNHPRVTLYGYESGDELSEHDAGDEVNEDQNDADDGTKEKQSDADEYSDVISSPMHEGNHSP